MNLNDGFINANLGLMYLNNMIKANKAFNKCVIPDHREELIVVITKNAEAYVEWASSFSNTEVVYEDAKNFLANTDLFTFILLYRLLFNTKKNIENRKNIKCGLI